MFTREEAEILYRLTNDFEYFSEMLDHTPSSSIEALLGTGREVIVPASARQDVFVWSLWALLNAPDQTMLWFTTYLKFTRYNIREIAKACSPILDRIAVAHETTSAILLDNGSAFMARSLDGYKGVGFSISHLVIEGASDSTLNDLRARSMPATVHSKGRVIIIEK